MRIVEPGYVKRYLNPEILGVTGMRPAKISGYNGGPLEDLVKKEIARFINHYDMPFVISGMAQGVDTWVAEEVLKKSDTKLICAVWDGNPGGTANCIEYALSKCCFEYGNFYKTSNIIFQKLYTVDTNKLNEQILKKVME